MNKEITKNVPAGLDLGDRYTYLCLLDTDNGEVFEEGKVRTTPEGFARLFDSAEPLKVSLEAGTHSPWVRWLGPIVETIGSLTEQIKDYDRRIEQKATEEYPETELLRQVPGVGPLTALTFALTLEDPHRLDKSRSVGAYLGLTPGTDRSGEKNPQKGISKAGDEMLLRLLFTSARYNTQ